MPDPGTTAVSRLLETLPPDAWLDAYAELERRIRTDQPPTAPADDDGPLCPTCGGRDFHDIDVSQRWDPLTGDDIGVLGDADWDTLATVCTACSTRVRLSPDHRPGQWIT